jgi:hypothetical protein
MEPCEWGRGMHTIQDKIHRAAHPENVPIGSSGVLVLTGGAQAQASTGCGHAPLSARVVYLRGQARREQACRVGPGHQNW